VYVAPIRVIGTGHIKLSENKDAATIPVHAMDLARDIVTQQEAVNHDGVIACVL
jgi:hypothetical protein